ncbi:hypothetical protein L486_01205 [Kwoniella mangroviensis CBS 10435]|uniref:Mediator of RNA polymerase II transcription subunit 13 n=1 Tax=Kwoniella mangroviensis CBS 10435 TaxID=1331196 RepID=A0A1B9J1A6_9TREE|nr:hypothetical protein L486_01205 [Kwoniella mangroviensis CBS 10435]
MTEFLGDSPPRPTTVIPGQWIIQLPSPDTQVYIHGYKRARLDNEAGPSNYELEDVILDPFERAWRQINDSPNDQMFSVNNLERPCAIISQTPVDEKQEKVLWVFITSNDQIVPLDGLEEITPHHQPISITQLVTCPKHGHDPSCLDSQSSSDNKTTCIVSLDTSQDVARHLDLLASALAERMAWKKGTRLILDSKPHLQSSLKASIRPISSLKLLLSVRPSTHPIATSSITLPPLRLLPLNLPALHVSSSSLTSTQHRHLASTFDSALGHTWKHGRSESRTLAQITGETYSDWSIYWVPLSTPSSSKGKLTPRQLVERWKNSQGLLTIWPTHLAQPYFATRYPKGKKSVVRPLQPKSSDLLDISTGVFDFLSSYKEPDPPLDHEDDEDEEADENIDVESTVITAEPEPEPIGNDVGGSEKSDIDDLFSEHSNSITNSPAPTIPLPIPPPDPILDQNGLEPVSISVNEDDTMNFINMDMNMDNENRQLSRNASNTNGLDNTQKEEMVTEDDFAFFDSPTDQIANEGELNESTQENHVAEDDRMNLDLNLPSVLEVQPDLTLNVEQDLLQIQIPTQDQTLPLEAHNLPTSSSYLNPTALVDDEDIHPEESPHPITADVTALPRQPPSPVPLPFQRSTNDLIPLSFSPLPLLPISESPFPYSLPTPAPTPSSLNWDLVERLQPPKTSVSTYANDWKMDEEISEIDEEEMYTGPPTPESAYTSSDEDEGNTFINDRKRLSESNGTEIEFSGVRCIASEWVYLAYEFGYGVDGDRLKEFMRDWNPSWIRDMTVLPPTPPAEVADRSWNKGLDLKRFVKDMIGNRALRQMLDYSDNTTSTIYSDMMGLSILDGGITLSDLSKESKQRFLPQPQISAGYHNYTINLSIPSLQYWSELGLQPHGGYKDVEAIILCEDTDEAREKGKEIGIGMKRTWEELHLGSHHIAEIGGATQGVISVPTSVFSEAVANLMNQSPTHTILYILLPPSTTISSSLLNSLFNISLSPSSSTVIQLVPQCALNPSCYREIAFEVYNRISEPVKEINARSISDPYGLSQHSTSDDHLTRHAFTLARDGNPTPEFSMSWPLKSYDVLNIHRSIHAVYNFDEDLGVMMGFIVDDLGEMFDWMIWGDQIDVHVDKIWKWIRGKSDDWLINWRLNVMRVGKMYSDELQAWRKVLSNSQASITLLTTSYDLNGGESDVHDMDDIPRPKGFANIPLTTLNDPNSQIIDLSLSAQLTTLPSVKLPIGLEVPNRKDNEEVEIVYPVSSFILTHPSSSHEKYRSAVYNILHRNHSHGKKNLDTGVEDELGEEIYRIGCLIDSRWGINGGLAGLIRVGIKGLSSLAQGGGD